MKSSRTLVWLVVVLVAACFAPYAHAALGVCDASPSGAVEIESTGGTPGPTGYATLGAAFAAINAGTHTGAIDVEVCGDTTEAATATLNASGTGGASYTSVAVKPAGGFARTITGAIAGVLLDLNGASNVTIDGLASGGNALTLNNTSPGASAVTLRFIADASSNTVQRCTIMGSGTSTTLGTITFSTGVTTGNLNNTISGTTIAPSGANLPTNAIYSAGTSTTIANSGTVISGNLIQDYFSAATASNGIYVASNSAAWTITGNSFFQTATRTATTANSHRAINIVTASGGGYTVASNVVGYASAAATGVTTYAGSVANRFFAIEMTVATSPASSIQNNTVTAISLSTTSGASSAPGIFTGISVLAGSVTTSGNTIGAATGNGAITVTSTTGGGYIAGLYTTSTGTVTIQNNVIGGVSTGGTATIGYVFRGIDAAGAGGSFTIASNTIGSAGTTNSIAVGTSGTTTAATTFTGINNAATGTISITGNTVQNCSSFGTGSSAFNGIASSGGTGTLALTGNNVIAGTNAGTGTMTGISTSSAAATVNVTNNVLRNLTITSATGALTAISQSGSVTTAINLNDNQLGNSTGGLVTFSSASAASGAVTGITNSGGTSAAALSIQRNDVRGITYAVNAGSSAHVYLRNTAATLSQNFSTNTFTNLNVSTTGSVTFMSNDVALPTGGSVTASNNAIVTGFTKTGAGGTVTLYLTTTGPSSVVGSTKSEQNNNFSNISVTGSTVIAGWTDLEGATGGGATKTIAGNTFSNWTGGTGGITVLQTNYGGNNTSLSNNTVSSISGQSTITGISLGSSNGGAAQTVGSNSISGLTSSGTGGAVVGITGGSSSITALTVTGNTISALSSTSSATGISISAAATVNITLNNVYTLSSAGGSSTVAGIVVSSGTTPTISRNVIYALSGTGATAPLANGIQVSGGTTVTVSKNKIYDVAENGTVTPTGPVVNGILLSGGTTVTASNNIVGDLRAPATNYSDAIRGISITSTTTSSTYNVYYNTVYLHAVSSGAVFGTSGLYHAASATATTAKLDLRNTIVDNRSTPNGAGLAVAYRRSAGTAGMLANYAGTSNNNDFFAGTPDASHLIYSDGVGTAQTIAAYKAGVFTAGTIAPRDSASFSDPTYLSTTGADPTFLHIDPTIATQVESGAVNVSGITDDFDGDIRQGNAGYAGTGSAPDVGADEFNGIGLDLSAPAISYQALTNGGVEAVRVLSNVVVTDATGVNITSGTRPRVYYKKSTDANDATGWKFVEANGSGASPFAFTIDYSLLAAGSVSIGDVIQYFVVAQDTATTPNVGINSGTFAAPPASVALTSAAFPIGGTINSYTIVPTFTGSKTICPTGCDYASLTNTGGFFEAVNSAVLGGNVVASITGDLTAESGSVGLNQWGEIGAGNYTLTIVPSGGPHTVTATSTATTLIRLNGADRVTIDGSVDGLGTDRSLTLNNPNSTTNGVGVVFLGSQGIGAGATNDTIKNCVIKGGTIGTTSIFTFGVFVGDVSGASAGADNDNLTLQNNQVLGVRTGLQMVGTAAGLNDNTVISGNLFGDAVPANSIGRFGMVLQYLNNGTIGGNTVQNVYLASDTSSPAGISASVLTGCSVTGNTITNVKGDGSSITPAGVILQSSTNTTVSQNNVNTISASTSASTLFGMYFGTATTGLTVTRNTVSGVTSSVSSAAYGISIQTGVTASSVTRNIVTGISNTNTGGYGARGIYVNTGSTTSGLTLANNAVSDIASYSDTSTAFSFQPVGLFLDGTSGGINVYHNSVNLSGAHSGLTGATLQAAVFINTGITALDMRDNVFVNTYDNSSTSSDKSYAVYSAASAPFTTINFNDYFVSGTPGVLGYLGADRTSLAAWQAATTQDGSSLAVDPLFNAPTNLQPQTGAPIIGVGTPLAAVTVDLLGVPRSATNPTLGAYETAVDTSGPAITYAPLGNSTSTASRTLAVAVTDGSGVPNSGIGLPQVYFRKGSVGAFTGNQCVFVGGANYDCIIDTSALGLVAGDVVQYYVAAQDTVGNVSVSPSAGAAGLTPNPPAAGTPPTTPSSYTVATAITGSYNVGPGETYTSLTNAGGIFEAINSGVLTGNTVIDFTGDLTAETGAVALNQFAEEGVGGYTLTFKPAGAARTISGNVAIPLIKLNGADRVTFDGSLAGGTDRSLTVTNTNASGSIFWIASASAANGANNDTIKNCILTGNGTTTTLGAILAGSGTTVGGAAEAPNSNNTIQNNLVTKAQNALYISGATALDQNWTVTGNTFGSAVAAEKLGFRGVFLANAQNFTITGNTILGITTSTTSTTTGIQLGSTISGGTISRNRISDVKNTNSGGYGANGINLGASSTASGVLVANNVIYDVAGYGYTSGVGIADNGYGIIVTAGGGYALHFNSIRLTTNQTTGGISAALNVTSGVTAPGAIDLRDNIIANTETTGTRYAVYCAAASTVFTDINYNDYYSLDALGYIGGAARSTLAAWQGQTGKDMNSIAADPAFISATDLRIGQASPAINAGTPIASVPTDFVGVTRSATTPTLGAYEQGAAADLAVTQRADVDPVAGGTTVTYTVTVTNNGAVAAANAKLTDTVPAHMSFVSVTPPAGWTCGAPSGGTYDCTTASLAPAAPVDFNIVYRADWCTTATTPHTVSVSTTTGDANMADNTSSLDSNITDPGSCDDGNACTLGDSCVAGSCVGAPKDCSDGSLCTSDSCDTVTGACSNPPITCNDNNTCTDDSCNAATGCVFAPNDANSCTDGSACTDDDHCSAGSCVGTQPNCDDGNGCTDDSCNPTSGACVHTNAANACDDANACTSGDVCAENSSFAQNFDGVTAPALPAGWTTAVPEGLVTDVFTTVTDFKDTAPNAAWTADTDSVSDKNLTTPAFTVATATTKLYFMHKVDLERSGSSSSIYDGAVLEISIAGGAFSDFVTAGGTFETGGYTGPITATANPLYPRNCWTGATTGFVQVKAAFPAAAAGQSVQLRWRVGTDGSVGHSGYWLDSVRVAEEAWSCHSGAPVVCNDANACTDDACNTATGCVYVPVVVDDSNPCTVDSCDTVTGVAHVPGNAGTVCRGAAGVCDATEVCDGTNAACPGDAKSTAECRAAAGLCDVAEACDGVGNDCPADQIHPAGFTCRASAGDCDVAELCDGSATACPADAFQPATTECRPSAGVCDVADFCSGAAATCVADAKSTAECRPAAGVCDVAEACDGVNNACPADQGLPLNYTYYADSDGDTYGNPATAEADCRATAPAGRSADNTDCNDASAAVHPGATEVPGDGIDEDCNGAELCYTDGDHDAYGTLPTVSSTNLACNTLGEAAVGTDCNDGDAAIHPGAVEHCDGVDENCDGLLGGPQADADCQEQPADMTCTTNTCSAVGVCTISGVTCSVSGHVFYYRDSTDPDSDGTLEDSSTKGVPGVTLDLTGDATGSATSSADGAYSVPAGGSYTLTLADLLGQFTKPADLSGTYQDGISSLDATYASKSVVALKTLSPRQRLAADVTGNGRVTSFDASLIAQKAVGLITRFPVATLGGFDSDWALAPRQQIGTAASASATDVDFVGVLYGDVTGNWGELASSFAADPEPASVVGGDLALTSATTTVAPRNLGTSDGGVIRIGGGGVRQATLYLATAPTRNADGSWTVVLGLSNADGILGLDLGISMDPQYGRITGIRTTGIASGMHAQSNESAGTRAVSLFGVTPLAGTGEFLVVTLTANGNTVGQIAVSAEANEGQIPLVIDNALRVMGSQQ